MGLRAGIVAVLLLAFSGLAAAESETQKIAEIGGEITVDSDGNIKAISLANVKDANFEKYFIGKIKTWSFYPVEINGKPVEATSKFRFNLITTYLPDKKLKQIEFANVSFEPSSIEIDMQNKVGFIKVQPNISYPIDAFKVNAQAIVKIALDISADGKIRNAEVFSIELINTGARSSKFFANEFSKSALRGAWKIEISKDQLAFNKCINGCVNLYEVRFSSHGSNVWQSYERVPVAPIPWVIAADLKDINDAQQSQLVRFKEDPTGKPIEIGG